MRVFDIITENKKIDEAPVGAVRQGLRRLGAKAAGAVGMSRTAGNLGAKADSGAEANSLEKGFSTYLGKQMKSIKQATAQDLARHLQQSGYPIDHMKGMSGVLQPKQIDDLTLKAVTDKAAGAPAQGVGGDAEPQATPAQGAKKQGALGSFVQGVKQGMGGKKQAATPTGQKPKIPANIVSQINKLSDQQKQELVKLL
jgi:hypothetical protein